MNPALIDYYYRGGGGGASFTAEYQAVLDYATLKGYTLPSEAGKITDDALIVAAKANGLWDAAPRFYNHHTDGGIDYACIDYKNPSDSTLVLRVNNPTYAIKTGFTGNASNMYLNYQWIPSTQGASLYTQNDAGFIYYSPTTLPSNNGCMLGCLAAGVTKNSLILRSGASFSFRINCSSAGVLGASSIFSGLIISRRTSNISMEIIQNGISLGASGLSSDGLCNVSMYGLCFNNNGTPSNFSDTQLDCFIPYKQSVVSAVDIKTMWDNHRVNVAAL